MSSFPYNTHKGQGVTELANGCPLNYTEVFTLAEKVRYWHGVTAETDNWTQSNDGAYEDTVNITLGLMELLSDPGAVRRLEITGRGVRKTVNTLLESTFDTKPFHSTREIVAALFKHSPTRKSAAE